MFNHSNQNQNVVWDRDPERLIITYRALRDIPVGEELCKCTMSIYSRKSDNKGISYGSHLTFEDTDDAPDPMDPEEELQNLNSILVD